MTDISSWPVEFEDIAIKERPRAGARPNCIGDGVRITSRDGASPFSYVHAVQRLPGEADKVLMIGWGATLLERRGRKMTVIDIKLAAEIRAQACFGPDPRVTRTTEEAGTFPPGCMREFDAIAIDACDAFGLIDPLTAPFGLVNATKRLSPGWVRVLNIVGDKGSDDPPSPLAYAMDRTGFTATQFRPNLATEGDELLHPRADGDADGLDVGDMEQRPEITDLDRVSLPTCVPQPINVSRRATL